MRGLKCFRPVPEDTKYAVSCIVMRTGSEKAVGEGIASCFDRSTRLSMVVHGTRDSCRRAALHTVQMAPNHGCERLVAKQPGNSALLVVIRKVCFRAEAMMA
jgi:hypothetical protein